MSSAYGKSWNPAEYYKNSAVAESYDRQRFASVAGRLFNALEQRLIRKAFKDLPRGATIGDVPCGTGRLAEALLKQGFAVLGIDISPQMLRVAASRLRSFGSRFQMRNYDARQLAGSSLQLDAALCARVLMHFPLEEQIEFLRNVASVTNGPIVFTQGLLTPFQVCGGGSNAPSSGKVRPFIRSGPRTLADCSRKPDYARCGVTPCCRSRANCGYS